MRLTTTEELCYCVECGKETVHDHTREGEACIICGFLKPQRLRKERRESVAATQHRPTRQSEPEPLFPPQELRSASEWFAMMRQAVNEGPNTEDAE